MLGRDLIAENRNEFPVGDIRIETARLILRPHSLREFEPLHAMFSDPEVMKFAVLKPSREDVWNRLLRYAGHWQFLGYGLFVIVDKRTGQFIGESGLMNFQRSLGNKLDDFPEAAWNLVHSAQGQGFALEAAMAAHEWFDTKFARKRTVCLVDPRNLASQNLAHKVGYSYFGQTRYLDNPINMYERFIP